MNFNLYKLFEEFIEEVKSEGTYASEEEIREATKGMLDIILNNKDATPEELVEMIITENIMQLEAIRKKYPIPGYTVGVNVDNINVKMYGGDIDQYGRKMPDNALFDLASITKFYTQIIAYNLIKDGYFSFSDRVRDLVPEFMNLGDVTIGDISMFIAKFQTDGRLDSKSSHREAINTLYDVRTVETGTYNYNDIGMMIMKEVMESVTGKSFEQLIKEYIVDKYGLEDTHLIIPDRKIIRATGSPNSDIGMVNDPSALALGGFSGHAGMFASSDDLIKLGKAIHDGLIPADMLNMTYTPGVRDNRGIMGNTYTPHEKGIDKSYVDILEPKTNFSVQGSTRVQLNIGKNSICSILLNPASMSLDSAREMERRINSRLLAQNKSKQSLIKILPFDGGYYSFDVRNMAPSAATVEPITTSNAILALRLRFLSKVIKAYEKDYDKEINVSKSI